MARFDAASAQVSVFTFKEGLLSAVAHDLELRLTRFTIEEAEGQLTADFDAASLRVVCAMKDGRPSPGTLPAFAHGEIEKNAAADVLDVRRHPRIAFVTSEVRDDAVVGQLTLRGETRRVEGRRRDEAGRRVAEFRLDVRDFGIKPFSAMLGTLKLKPEVVARVSLPA